MRKIKVYAITSLDGFTARINGDTDWVLDYPDPSGNNYGFGEFFNSIDSVVFDRSYYISAMSDGMRWRFADKRCYVVCDEEFYTASDKNINFMLTTASSPVEQVKALQQTPGNDIWLAGDDQLMAQLMEHGMVDELIINILPIQLEKGQPLSPSCHTDHSWQLVNKVQFDNGMEQLHYVKA